MTTPRSRRRLLFVAIALLLLWLVVEGLGFAGWWLATGECFTWSRAAAARANAGPTADRPGVAPDPQHAVHAGSVVHPYLGYVDDAAAGSVAGFPISLHGFVDDRSPVRHASPDRYVVGVVGGSVALQLSLYAESDLAAALQRSPALAGRRVEFVRLGLGGYKQPQQLFAVGMVLALGGHFDCIVNLDGFNEIALVDENVPFGVPAWYPRGWARLLDAVPTTEQLRRLGQLVVLREQRQQRAEFAASLAWSPFVQFVWRALDRRLQARLAELTAAAERAPAAMNHAVRGPGTAGASVAAARREMAALWGRSSLALHALCTGRGIRYFHFLQPNQYVPGQKPIGAAEAAVAIAAGEPWQQAVVDGYPLLQQEGAALRAAGVAFTDLTGVFHDRPEPLYVDTCCHLDRAGNALLAEHVAAAIRRTLELEGAVLQSLRLSPATVAIDSPLAASPLSVLGRDGAGREHDLSGAGFGTRVWSEPADLVTVLPDGRLRAARRGSGVLHAAHGDLRAEAPLACSWPDLLVGNDARPGQDGMGLQLAATAGPGPTLRVRCTAIGSTVGSAAGANGGANGIEAGQVLRLLAVATEPLPATQQPQDRLPGLVLLPIPAGAAVDIDVPLPPEGRGSVYVRGYGVAAASGALIAASNTVVVTRD